MALAGAANGGVDPNLPEIAYNAVDQRTALAQPITPGDPAAPRWAYHYDLNGDLSEQTSPRGVTIRFHRDALRRLVLEDFAPYTSDPGTPGTGDVVHAYHGAGPGIGQLAASYGRHGIRTDLDYDCKRSANSVFRDTRVRTMLLAEEEHTRWAGSARRF